MSSRKNVIKLDRRITFQFYTETQNQFGEKEVQFSNSYSCWAKIDYRDKSTTEDFQSKRETATTAVIFTIRWIKDLLDKKNRIQYNDQIYDIISIQEVGRRKYLKIEAQLKE